MPGEPYVSITKFNLDLAGTQVVTVRVICTPTPAVPDCRAVVTQAVQAILDAYPDAQVV